ncbi:hypothetical protein AAY473_007215 [Plecturocebus cupreus]
MTAITAPPKTTASTCSPRSRIISSIVISSSVIIVLLFCVIFIHTVPLQRQVHLEGSKGKMAEEGGWGGEFPESHTSSWPGPCHLHLRQVEDDTKQPL